MLAPFSRLSAKLTLMTLVFLASLALATILLVVFGFERTQVEAAGRSAVGLEKQGGEWLLSLAQTEAGAAAARLQPAAGFIRTAALTLVESSRQGVQTNWNSNSLTRGLNGFFFDTNPNRRSEVMASPVFTFSALADKSLRESAVLESLFPALLNQYPDAVAIYFISSQNFLRYYPVINLSEKLIRVTDWKEGGAYIETTPARNPQRRTVWFSPYLDEAGQGLLVTASTPVYAGDEFQGAISVDVSLTRLVERLTTVRPTQGSYAFLVDSSGDLVAAPDQAYADIFGAQATSPAAEPGALLGLHLNSSPNTDLRQVVAAMQRGETGLRQLKLGGTMERSVFLAYAPLSEIGWGMALVAPAAEITAGASAVADSIRTDARATVRTTLFGFGLAFLLAALGMALFSRRLLTRPIAALVEGVRAIAAGRLDVSIPVSTRDELGLLATAFNQMTSELHKRNAELAEAGLLLEQRVVDRTRQLSTLLDVSQNVASTLQLTPLLELILDQLHDLVGYQAASIWITRTDQPTQAELVEVARRGPAPTQSLPYIQEINQPFRLVDVEIREDINPGLLSESTLVSQPQTDCYVALRAELLQQMRQACFRSSLVLPLVVKEHPIGVILLFQSQLAAFTDEHQQLGRAIANQAAVALENARLYEQAQQLAALQERQRLARELHDSVSQALYGIALGSRTARTLLERDTTLPEASRQALVEPLDYVLSLADAGLAEMRALIFELRPESLETEGLAVALTKQGAALQARYSLQVRLDLCAEPPVPLAWKEACYRIAQESFNNIVKHAQASQVAIGLSYQTGVLSLSIRDDGKGFDPQGEFPGHLGLKSMRERLERLGGRLQVTSALGEGTTILAEIQR